MTHFHQRNKKTTANKNIFLGSTKKIGLIFYNKIFYKYNFTNLMSISKRSRSATHNENNSLFFTHPRAASLSIYKVPQPNPPIVERVESNKPPELSDRKSNSHQMNEYIIRVWVVTYISGCHDVIAVVAAELAPWYDDLHCSCSRLFLHCTAVTTTAAVTVTVATAMPHCEPGVETQSRCHDYLQHERVALREKLPHEAPHSTMRDE